MQLSINNTLRKCCGSAVGRCILLPAAISHSASKAVVGRRGGCQQQQHQQQQACATSEHTANLSTRVPDQLHQLSTHTSASAASTRKLPTANNPICLSNKKAHVGCAAALVVCAANSYILGGSFSDFRDLETCLFSATKSTVDPLSDVEKQRWLKFWRMADYHVGLSLKETVQTYKVLENWYHPSCQSTNASCAQLLEWCEECLTHAKCPDLMGGASKLMRLFALITNEGKLAGWKHSEEVAARVHELAEEAWQTRPATVPLAADGADTAAAALLKIADNGSHFWFCSTRVLHACEAAVDEAVFAVVNAQIAGHDLMAVSQAYAALAASQRLLSKHAAEMARIAASAADTAEALESVADMFARAAKPHHQHR